MTAAIDWTLTAAALPVLAASTYLLLLTLLSRRPVALVAREPRLRFCILVPAHDEERGIGATIRSLDALDYPSALRQVVVIADNCSDDTAGVSAAHGAGVIERRDVGRRGKGWALQYGIEHVLDPASPFRDWDALVVVDADTLVSGNLLRVLSSHLEAGARAVQAAYMPRPAGTGPIAIITEVAFSAFHLVRSSARERLGLSCGLRGNGMAFRRDLLCEVSHAAFSKTEDLEFGIRLGLHGVRVAFAGETRVYGDMPERRDVVALQRERWIGGRAAMARRFVPALLADAIRRRSLVSADLAIDLLVPPLSVLVVLSAAGVAASGAAAILTRTPTVSAAAWSLAFAALGAHVAHAARLAGRGRAFLRAATAIPAYALRKTVTAVRAVTRPDDAWVRTLREGETK